MADSSSDAATLKILVDIQAKLDSLTAAKREIKDTGKEAQSLAGQFKEGLGIGAGMLTVSGVVEVVKELIKETVGEAIRLAGEIKNGAANLGISTTGYQVFSALVRETGGNMESLTGALNHQQHALVEAVNNGVSPAAAAFRALGLNVAQLQGLSIEGQFTAIAHAISEATNKQEAFRNASVLLGERNLPRLREALRTLGEEGYDKVKQAADATIMSPEAVGRIAAAAEAWKRVKDIFVSKVGDTFGGLLGLVGVQSNIKEPENKTTAELQEAQKLADQQKGLVEARASLQRAQLNRSIVESDSTNTDLEKREQLDHFYDKEIAALQQILNLRKAMPIAVGETDDQRAEEIRKLNAQLSIAQHAAANNLGAAPSAASRINDTFGGINDPTRNKDFLTVGQGVGAGLQQFVSSAGSAGQQVAAALESTVGAQIGNLSQGVLGLIKHTTTWGQVGLQAADMFVSALIQTGIQMGATAALHQALVLLHVGGEATKTTATAAGTATRTGMEIGATVIHGIQVAFRVAAHVAGEAVKTAATIAGFALRLPVLIAESIAHVFHAAVGALSAMSSIPYVGPILAVAAMAAILGAGFAVVKGIGKGFADGGYTGDGDKYEYAGPAHKGEVIFSQADVARLGGPSRVDSIRTGSLSLQSSSSAAGGASGYSTVAGKPGREIIYTGNLMTARQLHSDPEYESSFVDLAQRRRGEILGG